MAENEEIHEVVDGMPVTFNPDEVGGNEAIPADLFEDAPEEPEEFEESSDAEKAGARDDLTADVVEALGAFEDDRSPLKLGAYSQPVFHDDAIRVGDVGGQIRMLRAKLAKTGAFRQPDLIEDRDDFDPLMQAAVLAFQRDNELEETGDINAETFAALRAVE